MPHSDFNSLLFRVSLGEITKRRARPALPAQPGHNAITKGTGISVLVIDDDLGTRETFEWTLRTSGFKVATACCGGEAIALASSKNFDLLLLDWDLRDMSGTDVIRRLRSTGKACTRFVLMSGLLTTEITVDAMRLGATNVLEKPISVDDLDDLVRASVSAAAHPEMIGPLPEREPSSSGFTESNGVDAGPPASTAERWVRHALKACESATDLKTIEQWAVCAGVSYTTLRETCRLVRMRPYDARDLVRVLRAVIWAPREGCAPDMLLDVGEQRTLRNLLKRAGLEPATIVSLDTFFERQRFVPSDNRAVRLLRRVVNTSAQL